jgi:hypothetical protein
VAGAADRTGAKDDAADGAWLEGGKVRRLDAQVHSGENTGSSPTHVLFVELKEPQEGPPAGGPSLGPFR